MPQARALHVEPGAGRDCASIFCGLDRKIGYEKVVRNGKRETIEGSAKKHQESGTGREKKTHDCASSKIHANGPWKTGREDAEA